MPTWEAPPVPPESSVLRAARQELDRALQPPTGKHMRWCINKLAVLPTRDGSTMTAALYADNFIDVCGQYPDDLWSAGTLELLSTKTFRPSPSEMVEAVGKRFAERQRMLQRIGLMLDGPTAKAAGPFVPEPLDVRVRAMRDSFRRVGQVFKAAKYERELATIENRDVEDWARNVQVDLQATTERPPFKPEDTPSSRRCAELAAAQRAGKAA